MPQKCLIHISEKFFFNLTSSYNSEKKHNGQKAKTFFASVAFDN
jgi:hypothetical protein